MSPIDTWNAHVLLNFICDSIWPTNKILPKKWAHWVNVNRSLSQKVIAKVTIRQGMLPQEYWERMMVGMANEKFCALCSTSSKLCFFNMKVVAMLDWVYCSCEMFCALHQSILANHTHLVYTCMTSTADKKIKQ